MATYLSTDRCHAGGFCQQPSPKRKSCSWGAFVSPFIFCLAVHLRIRYSNLIGSNCEVSHVGFPCRDALVEKHTSKVLHGCARRDGSARCILPYLGVSGRL